ncbi:MAG: exodeoxyribonuclease V subunit alpha [Candidatus Sericytochromatia bacterium]
MANDFWESPLSPSHWRQLTQHSALSALDGQLARLLSELLAETGTPEAQSLQALLVAGALAASQQTAQQHACADLAHLATAPLDPESPEGLHWPALAPWLSALRTLSALAPPRLVGPPGTQAPLILEGECLYLQRYWSHESELAEQVRSRAAAGQAWPEYLTPRLNQLFGPAPALTDWQRVAAIAAVCNRLSVISGGPGTGKTTTVSKILALLSHADPELRVVLAAPTGKAAARLKESLQQSLATLDLPERLAALEASTLHRLLGTRYGSARFRHDATQPLAADVVIVDEASMIDLALMNRLLAAVPAEARLILLGDRDQLASVEAGCVLGDLCAAASSTGFSAERQALLARLAPGAYPLSTGPLDDNVVLLQQSWRFRAQSGLGQLARAVNAGDADTSLKILQSAEELRFVPLPAAGPKALAESVVAGFAPYLRAPDPAAALNAWRTFIVLAAVRRGPWGVEQLNATLEQLLGLRSSASPWYHRRPVMITENNYELQLFNGDVGIAWAGPEGLRVWFVSPSGQLRALAPGRLGAHATAWALTVHKSQGSEFERVLLVLPDQDSPVLTRELVYTGVTRAKQAVTLWGEPPILAQAISRRVTRSTGLVKRLSAPQQRHPLE